MRVRACIGFRTALLAKVRTAGGAQAAIGRGRTRNEPCRNSMAGALVPHHITLASCFMIAGGTNAAADR